MYIATTLLRSLVRLVLPEPVVDAVRVLRRRRRYRSIGVPALEDRPDVAYVGTEYGGSAVSQHLLDARSVCLCFGAGEDISFEDEIAAATGCTVHVFDPTPRAIAYCERLIADRERAGRPGRVRLHPFGVWSSNETLRFYAPANEQHVSHSILNMNGGPGTYFEAQCFTPIALMNRLGIREVDLVKLNIEGAEYEVVGALFRDGVRPRALCVTLDEMHSQLDDGATKRMCALVRQIQKQGYEAVHARGPKLTFELAPARAALRVTARA
jgi:FkbM family methyltransferase